MKRVILILAAAALPLGCYSAPDARELDPMEPVEVIQPEGENPAESNREAPTSSEAPGEAASEQQAAKATPAEPPAPQGDLENPADGGPAAPESREEAPVPGDYAALRYRGVTGGRFRFDMPCSPAQAESMLLDFQGTAQHRAWAKKFELKVEEENRRVATWHFEGKAGVNPVVDLEFQKAEDKKKRGRVIRFRLIKESFGLAAFFGDYLIEPIADRPGACRLTQRVFIDSGLWIANASKEEIEAGLREDAHLLRAWAQTLRPGKDATPGVRP